MENKSFKHIDLSTTLRATQISCQLVIPVIKDIYFHIGDKICFCYLKNLKKAKKIIPKRQFQAYTFQYSVR